MRCCLEKNSTTNMIPYLFWSWKSHFLVFKTFQVFQRCGEPNKKTVTTSTTELVDDEEEDKDEKEHSRIARSVKGKKNKHKRNRRVCIMKGILIFVLVHFVPSFLLSFHFTTRSALYVNMPYICILYATSHIRLQVLGTLTYYHF